MAQDDSGDASGELTSELDRRLGYAFHVEAAGDRSQVLDGGFDLDAAKLNLSYAAQREDGPPRTVNASIQLLGVYEYRDRNDNDRFDLGDDVVTFNGAEASRFAHVEHLPSSPPVEAFGATYRLEDGGELQYKVFLAAEPASTGPGRDVGPRDLAIRVDLQDVPASAEDTQLALAQRVDSRDVDQTGAQEMTVRGEGVQLLYDWDSYALIDGLRTPVQSAVLEQHVEGDDEERTEAVVVKTLRPGDRIHQEESVSIQHTDPAVQQVLSKIVGDPVLFLAGLLGAVLVVGGNAWRKLKHGGSGNNA